MVVCTPHKCSRPRRCTRIPFRQPISPALARRGRCVLDPCPLLRDCALPYTGSVPLSLRPMQRVHIFSGRSVITIPFAPLSADATTVLNNGWPRHLCQVNSVALMLPAPFAVPPSQPCRDVQLIHRESVPRRHRPSCMQLMRSSEVSR